MIVRFRSSQLAVRLILAAGLVLGIGISPAVSAQEIMRAPAAVACDNLLLAEGATPEALLADCTCPPKGCVRTQGYWGNKPGVVWPRGYSRNASFFRSGLTWQQVLDSPVRGDAYFILAHQYIAAVLNIGAGASAPNSLRSIVLASGAWFASAVPGTCVKGACQLQRSWGSVLDEYNNGDYPGAPKHCDED
ncbi:hypothetical protein [Massilia sp. 9I]|uniref:hypothetical protein n=1 Tax=Massilia sp. 9I TaxID=2653152 RepID=UPI0012F04372|nr:hypothetical protein [Massilia sp. 9I]VXB72964.1 hypothetical protein MASSI9I_50152 [Massilia sp. 9I]